MLQLTTTTAIMTDYVHLPNSTFDHSGLHLAPPNGLQGGSYISMLYYKDTPLYIQTPICTSRQGVVSGKRPYIDLMFSNHDVAFLEWLEALETDAIRLIHEKRNLWISSDIEKSDIEAGFTSPVRPYKGGKHYLIRAHVQPAKHLATGASASCSAFDENERPVPLEYIKPDHQMYAVIEFQGIKFTARSFQMEVALKQVLLVPSVPFFQSCVIRRPSQPEHAQVRSKEDETQPPPPPPTEDGIDSTQTPPTEDGNDSTQTPPTEDENDSIQPPPTEDEEIQHPPTNDADDAILPMDPNDSIKTFQTTTRPKENEDMAHQDLQEVNLDVLEELEHMHLKLKKPTQVYYEMYRIAKQKAKELKKNAIAAHLEAKQIKSAHMLEDSSDDSDDCDNNEYGDE